MPPGLVLGKGLWDPSTWEGIRRIPDGAGVERAVHAEEQNRRKLLIVYDLCAFERQPWVGLGLGIVSLDTRKGMVYHVRWRCWGHEVLKNSVRLVSRSWRFLEVNML